MANPKRCFVIGPMNNQHMPKLRWLAKQVVEPIVSAKGFAVSTPDAPEIGNIMYHVIRSCDRAQLVIADLTGNNPNVFYEMAILDAMGRACVPVKIETAQKFDNEDKIPFDRAAYRFVSIPEETEAAIAKLTPNITSTIKKWKKGNLFENPLTDYFEVPLSSFSSAFGLARGYLHNLIKPVVDGIKHGGLERVDGDRRNTSSLRLECVIPEDLREADRSRVDTLVNKGILQPELMKAPAREVRLYSWVDKRADEESVCLVDIPTTMATLKGTVLARIGRFENKNLSSDNYKDIQKDEIEQFRRYLRRLMDGDPDSVAINDRVKLVPWSKSRLAKKAARP